MGRGLWVLCVCHLWIAACGQAMMAGNDASFAHACSLERPNGICPAGQSCVDGACCSNERVCRYQCCAEGAVCVSGPLEEPRCDVRFKVTQKNLRDPLCPVPDGLSQEEITAHREVNLARKAMGLECAAMVPALNRAAQRHCEYYLANQGTPACIENWHQERLGCSKYVAIEFWDREADAGYTGVPAFEVMHFWGDPEKAVQGWIDSVWHRTPLLSPWIRDLGYGTAGSCDTMDFGRGPLTDRNAIATYPYPGQTDVPIDFDGREIPEPPAPRDGWPSGYPIHVYLQGRVTEHVLTEDGSTTPIEHQWLTPDDPRSLGLLVEEFVLYADRPLRSATRYRMRIVGANAAGPVSLDWTFATRGMAE